MKLTLFVWKSKEKSKETSPDYRITMVSEKGGFVPCGSGWVKSTKTGDKYISLQIDTEPTPWTKPESLNTDEENAKIKALKENAQKAQEMHVVKDDFNNF
jgi:uncharacterized protein (DUF736 family)